MRSRAEGGGRDWREPDPPSSSSASVSPFWSRESRWRCTTGRATREDVLVLSGEAVAIVEGVERPLGQWDFLHCPPGANHVIVGAGTRSCVVFRAGSRQNHTYRKPDGSIEGTDDWGAYTVDGTAAGYGACAEEETIDAEVAYARFPEPAVTRYRDGWLPDWSD